MANLVEVEEVKKHFPVEPGLFRRARKTVKAVDGVSFKINRGETLGLVGESGCGKTTTGRLILRLLEPTSGKARFLGHDLFKADRKEIQKLRPKMQIIFQDPFSSLNPRKTVRQILEKPYRLHRKIGADEIQNMVSQLLETVGLTPTRYLDRLPHELSGGEKQRIGIARAVALHPKFIVADEPVSSLDMSIKCQILNLMKGIQKKFGLSYLFITHDLAVTRSIATRVAVMYLGKIVELADAKILYSNPKHPYTKALLSATPVLDPSLAQTRKRIILRGDIPSPIDPPSGCRFHPRCTHSSQICAKVEPKLTNVENHHSVACHLAT